jgi:hypothetical protein
MKILKMSLILGVALGCIAEQGMASAVASKAAVAAAPASKPASKPAGKPAGKPAVPSVGVTYTLGQLFNLINTSNPNKTSNFIFPTLHGKVMTDAQCWPSQGDLLTASVSASSVDFGNGVIINGPWIEKNSNLQIQLAADPILLNFLVTNGRVAKKDQQSYGRILLYGLININGTNYRLYLNDPFPGKIVTTSRSTTNPSAAILNKWDLQTAFRP